MPDDSTRPLWFTALLAAAAVLPVIAIPVAFAKLDEIQAQSPKLTRPILWSQIAAALVGVAGAIALLAGRRYGVWLVLLSGVGVVGADLIYESYKHAVAATLLTTLIGLGARANWTRMR